jgi:hypothetical protein
MDEVHGGRANEHYWTANNPIRPLYHVHHTATHLLRVVLLKALLALLLPAVLGLKPMKALLLLLLPLLPAPRPLLLPVLPQQPMPPRPPPGLWAPPVLQLHHPPSYHPLPRQSAPPRRGGVHGCLCLVLCLRLPLLLQLSIALDAHGPICPICISRRAAQPAALARSAQAWPQGKGLTWQWRQGGGRVAAGWRQGGGRVAAGWRQGGGRVAAGSRT